MTAPERAAAGPVLVLGASGFLGRRLSARLLAGGAEVTGVGRSPAPPAPGPGGSWSWIGADTRETGPWQEAAERARLVVNLAGATIARRWTRRYKEEIHESRVATTRHVVEAIAPGSGTVLLNASATGWYGDRGEEELTEESAPGEGLLARICRDWEAAALAAAEKSARVVLMRFGVILGEGGALASMVPPFRFFLGGPLGRGRQWFPWIHIDDALAAAQRCSADPDLSGPVNFTAPEAVRQGDFARRLGRTLHRPALLPAPPFLLRLALGEFGRALLESQRVRPARLEQAGFTFAHTRLAAALEDILA